VTEGGLAVVETATSRAHTTVPHPSFADVHSVPPCQAAVRNRVSFVLIDADPREPGWSALGGVVVAPIYGSLSLMATFPVRGVPVIVSSPTLGLWLYTAYAVLAVVGS